MKTKSGQSLQGAIFALGIVCLITGTLQLTTYFIQMHFDVHLLPAFLTSGPVWAAFLLVSEILLLAYIVLRLCEEMHSAWRVALAVVAYLAVCLACAYMMLVVYSGHQGFYIVMVVYPIISVVIGLIKRIPGKTLIVFMIANFLYAAYPCIMYLSNKIEIQRAVLSFTIHIGEFNSSMYNAFVASAVYVLPVMLLLPTDLVLRHRLAAKADA